MYRSLYSLNEVASVAETIYNQFAFRTIGCFIGPLGVGKTTLIQAIFQRAGIMGPIQSPTFTYVQTYIGYGERSWNHFDLYRIDSIEQCEQLGFSEYFMDTSSFSVIEWPELLLGRLKGRAFVCDIRYQSDDVREILIYSI